MDDSQVTKAWYAARKERDSFREALAKIAHMPYEAWGNDTDDLQHAKQIAADALKEADGG